METVCSARYRPRSEVDRKLSDTQTAGRRLWNRHTPQRRTDPGQKFRSAERLGDEVVGAGIQSFNLVGLGVMNRQHDDGDVWIRANFPASSQAAHPRHIDIEQYQVRPKLPQFRESLFAGL